ncbi:hypothetical protein Glove_423g75 [Diversispora epigaea]|uniref:Uncharacterized protein n=1 Tax=Diversispora epigaea TaxID=1348612 RepID=A0A397GZE6_9GLOM|nr:hypothetical protein Glove_423g75 [Diversispora epigaea]
MSKPKVRPSTRWNITAFLEECDFEPFKSKTESYTTSLEVIADMEKHKKSTKYKKARLLLSDYKEATTKSVLGYWKLWVRLDKQPDYKVARKWKERKECNEPSVTITESVVVGPAVIGINKGTFDAKLITNEKLGESSTNKSARFDDNLTETDDNKYFPSDDNDSLDSSDSNHNNEINNEDDEVWLYMFSKLILDFKDSINDKVKENKTIPPYQETPAEDSGDI